MCTRAVKQKTEQRLNDCNAKIADFEARIQNLNLQVEEIRAAIQAIDKEINEAGASMANLRENLRVRKLINDIADTQAEIDTYDIGEAAKAKRDFNEKYQAQKAKETRLQGLVCDLSPHDMRFSSLASVFRPGRRVEVQTGTTARIRE